MLMILIKILHIAVAVFLILVVLLQTGKGAEMGAAFGGSSQTLFGSGGPAGFMAKLTTAAAVCFMLTSLGLAYVSSANRLGDVQLPASQQIPVPIPAETAPGVTPEASPEASPDTSQSPEESTSVPQAAGEETGTKTQ
jgi:preprotein translocase subunit SecG